MFGVSFRGVSDAFPTISRGVPDDVPKISRGVSKDVPRGSRGVPEGFWEGGAYSELSGKSGATSWKGQEELGFMNKL